MKKDPLEIVPEPEWDREHQMSPMKGLAQPEGIFHSEDVKEKNSKDLYFRYFSPPNHQELSPEEKNMAIQGRSKEARDFLKEAEDSGVSPADYFSCEVSPTKYTLNTYNIRVKYGYDSHGKSYPQTGMAKPFFTFRDVEWLMDNYREEQYKLYFSLNLNTPEKEKIAENFAEEIVIACQENRVSLMEKPWGDHSYDSMLLYTWDIDKLKNIVSNFYQKYKETGIFLVTKHIFQGGIDKVSPDHIGWVQEPGFSLISHSGRMGRLGELLAEGVSYEDACNELGILPEAPWRFSKDFLSKKKKKSKE